MIGDKKICPTCKCKFEITVSSHQDYCKPCKRAYDREYHKTRSKEVLDRKWENQRKLRRRNAQFVWDYLLEHPCIECGNSNPIVLEFDHRNGKKSEKYCISNLVRYGFSLENIKAEIKKCDVMCANCHKIRTAKQLNWYLHIDNIEDYLDVGQSG